MRSYLDMITATAILLVAATEAALAAVIQVPGPVAAVGAPALLVIGGAYWIVRRIRARRR